MLVLAAYLAVSVSLTSRAFLLLPQFDTQTYDLEKTSYRVCRQLGVIARQNGRHVLV